MNEKQPTLSELRGDTGVTEFDIIGRYGDTLRPGVTRSKVKGWSGEGDCCNPEFPSRSKAKGWSGAGDCILIRQSSASPVAPE